MEAEPIINIGERELGPTDDTYVIAEIGSNFDGSLERAKKLIDLASDCGADAAKFQAFKTEKIVSEYGFDGLKRGFQSDWDKSVYEVYREAELPREWIPELAAYTNEREIDFLCTPYDREAVGFLEDVEMPAYKIGSGDITWHGFLKHVAEHGKPVILSTGASTYGEIEAAIDAIQSTGNDDIVLLQCVTNYPSAFESANVRAMQSLAQAFDVPVGYSDHTPGSAVPLGAVSLGGCVIEKHFTDDNDREGPDHGFAMEPAEFKRMVEEIRNLEKSLGSPRKTVYEEEGDPIVLQRRCLRAARDIDAGTIITADDIVILRPAPEGSLPPTKKETVVGRTVDAPMVEGEAITWDHL